MKLDVEAPIKALGIDNDIILKLEAHNIKLIKDLWILKRSELKEIGFVDSEINHLRIKLQLCGLDLNKKMYI